MFPPKLDRKGAKRMKQTMSRKKKMAPSTKSDAARARAKSVSLTTHYRAIGPASVAAALLFMRKVKGAAKPA